MIPCSGVWKCNLSIYIWILDRYKLENGFMAGDEIWHIHSMTPTDEIRLCSMSVRV